MSEEETKQEKPKKLEEVSVVLTAEQIPMQRVGSWEEDGKKVTGLTVEEALTIILKKLHEIEVTLGSS